MARPTVSDATERIYARLAGFRRTADRVQDPDYPLLRYLASIGDQAGELETLTERIDFVPLADGGDPSDTSDLADPDAADRDWLEWLAQLLGVTLDPSWTEAQERSAISTAATGWRSGTKAAIEAAAKTVLTGTKYVEVLDHYNGDDWAIGVRTLQTETADDGTSVVNAILDANAKPAGFSIEFAYFQATWDTIEAERPTWTDWEASPTWEDLESTQPSP